MRPTKYGVSMVYVSFQSDQRRGDLSKVVCLSIWFSTKTVCHVEPTVVGVGSVGCFGVL